MCCEEICQAFGANDECCRENVLRAQEDGKKFILQLPADSTDTICCIHVDDCLIQDKNQRKCDYWFRVCRTDGHLNYFVEFKGSDIEYGFEQIVATIAQVRQKGILLPKESIHGIIVANHVPMSAPQIQVLKDRFKKHYGASFQPKSKRFDLTI